LLLGYNLRAIYETPSLSVDSDLWSPDRSAAANIVTSARKNDRTLLTEYESKQLLAAYGIPTIATSDREAVEIAEILGYPVVLKLHSETITHKTDVGGVQLI
jgi:acetyltransferase